MPALQQRARTRVLVIGEHPSLRRLLRLNLSHLPVEVQEASTAQAQESVGWELPHLVILDLHPPMDHGLALCRQLRSNSTTATIPALLLLEGGDHLRSLASEAGATVCLDKPLRQRLLLDTVQKLVSVSSSDPTNSSDEDPGLRPVSPHELEEVGVSGARLAARTAHHLLNTPLSLALGYADLLTEDDRLPPDLRAMAVEVRDNIQTAAMLLERLMRITRLEQRDPDLPSGPILDLARSTRER